MNENSHVSGFLMDDIGSMYALEIGICSDESEIDPQALTYAELDKLTDSDLYEELGAHVWIRLLESDIVIAAVLDWYCGECIAVTGYGDDNAFWGRNYGTEWIAYLDNPVCKGCNE